MARVSGTGVYCWGTSVCESTVCFLSLHSTDPDIASSSTSFYEHAQTPCIRTPLAGRRKEPGWLHTLTQTRLHTHTHANTLTHTQTRLHTHARALTRSHTYALTRSHTQTKIHTHTFRPTLHDYINTQTHTHSNHAPTPKHTYSQAYSQKCSNIITLPPYTYPQFSHICTLTLPQVWGQARLVHVSRLSFVFIKQVVVFFKVNVFYGIGLPLIHCGWNLKRKM